jgi:hypothetical protein
MLNREEQELLEEIRRVYKKLDLEKVTQIKPQSIKINFKKIVSESRRGVIHTIKENELILEIFAQDFQQAITVVSSLFAHMNLKKAKRYGSRHGSFLYLSPILHLLFSLLIIALGTLYWGFIFGIISSIFAAISLPFLIMWAGKSLENRRLDLIENLKITGKFESKEEINKTVEWLGTKTHDRKYWFRRALFCEIYYILILLLMIFLEFVW